MSATATEDAPLFYGKPLIFREKAHRYYWDGQPVPSVTTIINRLNKPLLIQWAANCAVDHLVKLAECGVPLSAADIEAARKAHATIRDEAGDVGKEVHEWARRYFLRMKFPAVPLPPEPEHPQARAALAAFRDWAAEHRFAPIGVERRVFSRAHMYAGTCDFFGRIDDRLVVLDFKTGNGVYDEAWYQMGGYEVALREELGLYERPEHWLIHLNKNTGECTPYARGEHETGAAIAVWHSLVALDKAIRAMPPTRRTAA